MASITASPSSRSTLQTTYVSDPPGATCVAARRAMAPWTRASASRSSGLRRCAISGRRLSVPVPLQGASTRTQSYAPATSPEPTLQSTANVARARRPTRASS